VPWDRDPAPAITRNNAEAHVRTGAGFVRHSPARAEFMK